MNGVNVVLVGDGSLRLELLDPFIQEVRGEDGKEALEDAETAIIREIRGLGSLNLLQSNRIRVTLDVSLEAWPTLQSWIFALWEKLRSLFASYDRQAVLVL